jgi:hypothetical protein
MTSSEEINMDATRQSLWCFILGQGFGKDFTGKVFLNFQDGGLCDVTPLPNRGLDIPRKMLPSKNFNGRMRLDCNLFTGTIIESIAI